MSEPVRMQDLPPEDRPRERLLTHGAENLSKAELIAILLRTGTQGQSALAVGQQLMTRFSSLDRLARASVDELRQVKGIGRDKAIALKAAFTLARRMAAEIRDEAPLLDTPESIANLLREESRLHQVETFVVILLNTRRRLIRVEPISQGTLDTLLVHPREVFKLAIAGQAAAIVIVHNHPSGDPTPSDADIKVTRDLI